MFQRIAYGAFAIALIFSIVGGDALIARQLGGRVPLLAYGSFIPLILLAVAAVACLELEALLRSTGVQVYRGWAVVSCLVLVAAPWLSAAGVFGSGPYERAAFHLQLELTGAAFLGTGVIAVCRRDVARGMANIAATWLVIGYAGLLTSFLSLLRSDGQHAGEAGAWLILTVILVCKVSDIGAYFLGSWFGRHKLAPAISPGKSIEGFVGGVAASVAVSLLFFCLYEYCSTLESSIQETHAVANLARNGLLITGMYAGFELWQAIVFGAVMSIVGQFGDLIESVFKRSADTKDSASILPGFGGILDMVDSPLAIAPVAWFLLTRAWGVL